MPSKKPKTLKLNEDQFELLDKALATAHFSWRQHTVYSYIQKKTREEITLMAAQLDELRDSWGMLPEDHS